MVDPIHPITPGPPSVARLESQPVERLERVSRERDRPSRDGGERKPRERTAAPEDEHEQDDGEHPHIDIRV